MGKIKIKTAKRKKMWSCFISRISNSFPYFLSSCMMKMHEENFIFFLTVKSNFTDYLFLNFTDYFYLWNSFFFFSPGFSISPCVLSFLELVTYIACDCSFDVSGLQPFRFTFCLLILIPNDHFHFGSHSHAFDFCNIKLKQSLLVAREQFLFYYRFKKKGTV